MIDCKNCGLALMSAVPVNAKRIASECKCGERVNYHVSIGPDGVPELSGHRSKRDLPPAAYSDFIDIEVLRLSATALRELRTMRDGAQAKIDALMEMRIPVMNREKSRVIGEAMSQTLMQAHGNNPLKTITAVLSQMDPDSAAELMATLMKEFSK